jgi:hypothetical protein
LQAVDGPVLTLAPGAANAPGSAQCPPGKTVIGTGFNASIGNVGFVKAYGTFVGGFFINDRSININVSVQAICASTDGAVAASRGPARATFERDVRKATAALH